jgi:Phage tail protein
VLRIAEITFTNSEGRSLTIGNTGKYLLTERLVTSGLPSTAFTTKAYNQHGRTFLENVYDEQSFTFNFLINNIGLSSYSIQSARREIADVFMPHLGEGTLSVTLETGDVFLRTVSVDIAPFFPSGFENSNTIWQHVEVEMVANNPYWYSSNEIFETFQAVEPLFNFPFTMSTSEPVIFGNVVPNQYAYNEGQAEAPVTIVIFGACVNPSITNVTTGEFIRFKNLTMDANDVLEIDTTFGQKKVELNGETVFNKLDFSSTFFNLKTGYNEIDFSDDTGSNTATIHFIYRNQFISI